MRILLLKTEVYLWKKCLKVNLQETELWQQLKLSKLEAESIALLIKREHWMLWG